MSLLIKNIKTIVHAETNPRIKFCGDDMSSMQTVDNGYIFIQDDRISEFGKADDDIYSRLNASFPNLLELDARGGHVFPSWCDSHTHLVYAGSREKEFVDRINGLSYEEIFSRGGGILNSAMKLRSASEEDLFEQAAERLEEIIRFGTGAVEIKSGYGLTTESELKMLRVISRLKKNSPLSVKATFLGAHACPPEYKNNRQGYLSLLINEMLPAIGAEKLADYCDIFCEANYFSPEDAIRLFEAADKYGMKGKVHAEQLSHTGGTAAGVSAGAVSVDHLEFISDEDISLLKNSDTMPVILPGAQFFLGLQPPPVRKMIDAGLPVAISSDYNPGSCPSGNMNQMISLACISYKLTPEEAIIAATSNSAYAMDLSDSCGSIARGKKANVFITKNISSQAYLPYSFGSRLTDTIILNGKIIASGLN